MCSSTHSHHVCGGKSAHMCLQVCMHVRACMCVYVCVPYASISLSLSLCNYLHDLFVFACICTSLPLPPSPLCVLVCPLASQCIPFHLYIVSLFLFIFKLIPSFLSHIESDGHQLKTSFLYSNF